MQLTPGDTTSGQPTEQYNEAQKGADASGWEPTRQVHAAIVSLADLGLTDPSLRSGQQGSAAQGTASQTRDMGSYLWLP